MLMQQFEQLNEKTQNALLSLHSEKSESSNLQEKLNDILDCNGIEVVPVNSVALYLTIPRSAFLFAALFARPLFIFVHPLKEVLCLILGK